MRLILVVLLLICCAWAAGAQTPGTPGGSAQNAQSGVKCAKCQHVNRPGAKFCAECGAILQEGGCPKCGAVLVPGDKFCTNCGLNLAAGKPTEQEKGQEPVEREQTYPSLKIGGFSDVTFSGSGRGTPRNFVLGQFVLHFNSALSPKVNFFSELSLSPRADAGTGAPATAGYNADVERAIIRFDQSDQLKLSAGRYHTPINWWNTAFHHGLWLQTSIARPEMTKFGGVFIPVHFVGGQAEGSFPAHGLNLGYNVGVGNGRGPIASRADDAGNSNSDMAWLVNLYVKPDKLYPLQVGGSIYRDKVTLSASGRQFREWIASGHVVFVKESPEILAEYAHVRHNEPGGVKTNSEGWYVQAAYRLPEPYNKWKPYYRFERLSIPAGEPVFAAQPRLRGSIFGVRYDVTDFAALKFEYRDLRKSPPPSIAGFFGQLCFAF